MTKPEYLRSKGWTTLWSEDNWIPPNLPSSANRDWAGQSTESAYQSELHKESRQKQLLAQILEKAHITGSHTELSDDVIEQVAKANYMSVTDIKKILNFDL